MKAHDPGEVLTGTEVWLAPAEDADKTGVPAYSYSCRTISFRLRFPRGRVSTCHARYRRFPMSHPHASLKALFVKNLVFEPSFGKTFRIVMAAYVLHAIRDHLLVVVNSPHQHPLGLQPFDLLLLLTRALEQLA
jgi:hypothetical protein